MPSEPSPSSEPLVLVVEDEPVMNDLVSEILRFSGFEVCSVASGEEALEACRQRVPDAVLLDIMLPGISGYEVCRQLKCSRRTNLVPVAILSSLDRRDDQVRGIRVGADTYITKPFEPDELINRLRRTIDEVRRRADQGLRGHLELAFRSEVDYLEEVNDLLLGLYAQSPLSEADVEQIRFSLLELGRRVIQWSGEHGTPLEIHMEYDLTDTELTFRLRDEAPDAQPGPAHEDDPLRNTFMENKLGSDEGGFGALVSKDFMDDIRFDPDRNEITLTKRFQPAE